MGCAMKDNIQTTSNHVSQVTKDPWEMLREYTDARIGLGRCGVSLPVSHWLDFRLAHAQARDAVFTAYDIEKIRGELEINDIDCLVLQSDAEDKNEFLTLIPKGRRLSTESSKLLQKYAERHDYGQKDVCLIISDGLSARAVHENSVQFALEFMNRLKIAGISTTPVCLVERGRVAVADGIASLLKARLSVILIGERPGLSSPNSMGVYMTYSPVPGCTDEARNCISNVRKGGLSIVQAVNKLCYLVHSAFTLQYSGVNLKDDMPAGYLPFKTVLELGE